jgi:Protein of unknown function (DUF2764)
MSDCYVTLMASLPPHVPALFANRQTPISRLKLDERLQMLEPQDASDLALIEELLHWDRMGMETTDAQMIERGRQARDRLENEFIKGIVCWRLEMRTVVAALRRRRLGGAAPATGSKWGYGAWTGRIESHWHEPSFGVERVYPWLPEADRLLKESDFLALERLLLSQVWDYYGRVVGDHYFDFEAVVVYVLRWDVIDRWARYNGEAAARRFDRMVEAALGDYAAMFAKQETGIGDQETAM